ncbi:hypothetical protein HMPREF9336_00137 [Segniliparus rugosus ATCC BAA-974]|uniref:Uncharacterized protein n=1 Tax=Segniliparus rugosus (strain ATCC BAA-974 / DSM 45345 / CCUG 50838 / CIP 108380 / JCM 13579 / CDC 945) TaxID=679197 RepID=E5XKW8_SEGRC|nr:hypothetical protein HMPREF9336_00137 [Segniliparus rugosus ATCC BAA-974]
MRRTLCLPNDGGACRWGVATLDQSTARSGHVGAYAYAGGWPGRPLAGSGYPEGPTAARAAAFDFFCAPGMIV